MLDSVSEIIARAAASNRPVAVGVYVFAGGFSVGAEVAGFTVAGHLEDAAIGLGVEACRRAGWPVVVLAEDDWASTASELAASGVRVGLMHCNPPCSAYSKQGSRQKMDDPVMECTARCVTAALQVRPKVFIWESVPDIFDDTEDGGRRYIEEVAVRFNAAGYFTYAFLTSSALHGGHQNRKRFHFVASHTEIDWHACLEAEPPEARGHKTLGDALEIVERWEADGLPLPNHASEKIQGGQLLSILPFVPPGGYLREVSEPLMRQHYKPNGRDWDGQSRAGVAQCRGRRDRVCPVITGGHSIVHPEHDRFLTVREVATVMGFPREFQFTPGSTGYAEVGKGLCVQTALFVCRAAMTACRSEPDPSRTPSGTGLKVVDWRSLAEVLPLPLTKAEREAWWLKRHPTLDIALSEPWRPKQGGRPKKSRNSDGSEPPASGPVRLQKSVAVVGQVPDQWLEAMADVGVQCARITPSSPPLAHGSVSLVLVHAKVTADYVFASALAWCHGCPLVYTGQVVDEAVSRFPSPPDVRPEESDAIPNQAALRVAELVGVDLSGAAAKMLAKMDPKELLAMLMGRGGQ